MGKTAISCPRMDEVPVKKRRKSIVLTISSDPKNVWRAEVAAEFNELDLRVNASKSRTLSSAVEVSSRHASGAGVIDIVRLFRLDGPVGDFLLPRLSFHDLAALECTCTNIRDIIRGQRWWRRKFESHLRSDPIVRRLYSRYSPKLPETHPDFHRRAVLKLHHDLSRVDVNVRGANFKKTSMALPVENACHKAYAVHDSGDYVFALNERRIEIYAVVLTKSKRGVQFQFLKSIDVGELDQLCSHLVATGDLLLHASSLKFKAWNWRSGELREIPGLKPGDVRGLGYLKAVLVKNDRLFVASNDAHVDGQDLQPSTGVSMVRVWRFDDHDAAAASGEKNKSVEAPKDFVEEGPDFGTMDVIRFLPTGIAIDSEGDLLLVGYGFYYESLSLFMQSRGKIVFYDLKTGKSFGVKEFAGTAVTAVKVNAEKRLGLIGFDNRNVKATSTSPYLLMLEADTGDVLRIFNAGVWASRCLWTDWTRFVFSGDDDGLLAWNLPSSALRGVDSDPVLLSGAHGLPISDRICHVTFDGFHLFLHTRGSTKATLRILDFLKLSSVRF